MTASNQHSGADVALIRESLISMQNMPEALHEFDRLVEQLETLSKALFTLHPNCTLEQILDVAAMAQEKQQQYDEYKASNPAKEPS